MRRVLHILLFAVLFLAISIVLHFDFVEAMPIMLLGGCIGWAIADFKTETRRKALSHAQSDNKIIK